MVSAGFGRSDHIRNVIYTRHYHDTDGLWSKTLSVYTHAAQGKLSWEVYHTFTSALYEIRITSKVRTVWSKLCTYVSSKGSRFHVGHWVQPDYQAFLIEERPDVPLFNQMKLEHTGPPWATPSSTTRRENWTKRSRPCLRASHDGNIKEWSSVALPKLIACVEFISSTIEFLQGQTKWCPILFEQNTANFYIKS